MWVFVLLLCVAGSFAERHYEKYDLDKAEDYFKEFMKTYNKHYLNEAEKLKRFQIFKQNLQIINKQNEESDNAVYAINKFSDLTSREFIGTYTGLNAPLTSACGREILKLKTAPDAFDWRDQNKVTDVKDQEQCGGCWAFSAVANLESQYAIIYNQTYDLSEQQLIDCDPKSEGCSGTKDLTFPFKYWMEDGPMLEKDYAYEAQTKECRADNSKEKPTIAGCTAYYTRDEEAVKPTLYEIGPLTIAIDANDLQQYSHGIMKTCSFSSLNHAVLLVGYGTEDNIPFWIIKNSWGGSWGENGYFRVRRGINACGIMNYPKISAILA